MEVAFAGAIHAGSLLLELDGWTLFSCPSDPDADPHMTAAPADPTPDQAEAMGHAILEWAALARARQHANDPAPLLVLMGAA